MSEPLINGGYILISRKIVESEIWDKPPLYIKVWLYLLNSAQHKPYKNLKRGQLFTSIAEIQEACSWHIGYRKEKPSRDQIYQIIDWLRKRDEAVPEADTKATMITTTKATQGMVINIDSYWFYQDPRNYESNNDPNNEKDTRATREQWQPININKNVKNDKNDKKEIKNNSPKFETCDLSLANELFELILKNNPNAKKPNLNKWAQAMRFIREQDKKTVEQIRYLINWSQENNFWKANILSPNSLRKHFDRLIVQVKSDKEQKVTKYSLFEQGEESKKRVKELGVYDPASAQKLKDEIDNDPNLPY